MNDKEYRSRGELWNRLKVIYDNDSIVFKYNDVWRKPTLDFIEGFGDLKGIDLSTAQNFETFVGSVLYPGEEEQQLRNELNSLLSERKDLATQIGSLGRKQLSNRDIETSVNIIALLLAILVYPIRFLFHAIRWSIRTLKS